MYKQACRQRLRFAAPQGELTAEQLWDLPVETLDTMVVSLGRKYKRTGQKSFLEDRTTENVTDKLRFDIVLDVLTTKVDEQKASQNEAELRAKRNKILELMAKKQEEALGAKTLEELEAELTALG